MSTGMDEKLRKKIGEQAATPEQEKRLKTMLSSMGAAVPPPLVNASVNMFELTVALCAAAQLTRYDVVDQKTVYVSSVKLAEMFFTRSGDFIERA